MLGEAGKQVAPFPFLHRESARGRQVVRVDLLHAGCELRRIELHIDLVYQGNLDKRSAYADIKAKTGLRDEEIAYIGDDIVDLPIMRMVGLPCAVGDAVAEVKEIAQIIAGERGGCGAVREIYEIIFKTQGLWERVLTSFQTDVDGAAQ